MKYNIFIIAIASAAVLCFSGCKVTKIDDTSKQELKQLRDKVKQLAKKAGVPSDKVTRSSAEDLLIDIEIVLSNEDSYYGNRLNDKEIKLLDGFLAGQQQTLKTIKDYHEYLMRMKGERVIILPND